jgi:hypothetical protein
MNRGKLFAGLGVAALVLVGSVLLVRGKGAGPSAIDRGPSGWLAARTYLARRGGAVSLADRPPSEVVPGPALVIAFPWQTLLVPGEADSLRARAARGGLIVFAYSGGRPAGSEELVARALGLEFKKVGGDPPLDPFAWYRFQGAESVLTAEPGSGAGARPVVVRALRAVPTSASSTQVLYRLSSGLPAVFALRLARGRVLVLPADALSNGRLSREGNADLLESLVLALPEGVVFDEYHHGLAAPPGLEESSRVAALDTLLFQLALLYALCVLALGRRFGPAWSEAPAVVGSTVGFLEGLGALHRQLGHSASAASLLLRRAEEWSPHMVIPESLRAAAQAGDLTLLELARAISRQQISRRT